MCMCTAKQYFVAILTHIRTASSIFTLAIHYLSFLFPDTGSFLQRWTQHNHMTDGKSILSVPVLTEHMAGEQKHLETSKVPESFR